MEYKILIYALKGNKSAWKTPYSKLNDIKLAVWAETYNIYWSL